MCVTFANFGAPGWFGSGPLRVSLALVTLILTTHVCVSLLKEARAGERGVRRARGGAFSTRACVSFGRHDSKTLLIGAGRKVGARRAKVALSARVRLCRQP